MIRARPAYEKPGGVEARGGSAWQGSIHWALAACKLGLMLMLLSGAAEGQKVPDARALGVHLTGAPGPNNAITDVAGVEVGHTTIIQGEGQLVVGEGPVRTGVTAILPRGRESGDSVFAAWFSLNGNCLLYTSPSPRDRTRSRMPASA